MKLILILLLITFVVVWLYSKTKILRQFEEKADKLLLGDVYFNPDLEKHLKYFYPNMPD